MKKKAFTIIEVTLVLALAGLIFVGVFFALPALMRTQKDNERRDNLARLMQAVEDYQMNNSGISPFSDEGSHTYEVMSDFVTNYLVDCNNLEQPDALTASDGGYELTYKYGCNKSFRDPDGISYKYKFVLWDDFDGDGVESAYDYLTFNDVRNNGKPDYVFYAFNGGECGDDEDTVTAIFDDRYLAVYYVLESGAIICMDNH